LTILDEFRRAKDAFFAADPNSPLTPDQKREFKGLRYFPEAPALRLELEVEEFTEKDTIQMQTSTGDVQSHIRAYNPYCAYNDQYSCPLTPWENRLKVPIRAGEKVFHEE